jgi:asparagine synthase (glutamine-hydrolysing)
MTAAQRHRGPDGEGLWSAPGVVLGHRRLKVLDLSEAGRQPMSTSDGRYTIVYNGEVYNYQAIRDELSGCVFRSKTDTEVVLYAYARWGVSCLDRFVGMYSLAIWDSVERQLFCARDRVGIKPFYYAQLGEQFIFASEIRPVLIAGVSRSVNEPVLYDFLARDFYEHTEDTFFEGVHKLPPGTWMFVKDNKVSVPRQYWHLKTEVDAIQVDSDPREREQTFIHLCNEAVRSHLRSDVPVGVALSGGLDSATLLALLDGTHPDPTQIEGFSFAFADPVYSEQPYVEALAQHTGRKVHFVEVSPQDFAQTAERFTFSQEEPFAGAPISAYALCFERARALGFTVIMDGSGIDEGLAGYDRFRPALWADLFLAGSWQTLERELVASGVTTPAQRKEAIAQIHATLLPHGDMGRGQDLTSSVRGDCLSNDFADAARRPLPHFERYFPDNLHRLMYRELRYTKLPRALRFRDRLSMAVGTELRPPFLDHRLLAYEFALPPDDLICQGVSKSILRRAAMRFLPKTVCLASKRSVQTPQREWFRNELKPWVRERIDSSSFWNRGWIDRQRGTKAMEAFFRGEGNNSFFLWQWMNLEMWAQQMLVG